MLYTKNNPDVKKKIDDFDVIKPIGKGCYGSVYLVEDKSNEEKPVTYAMK